MLRKQYRHAKLDQDRVRAAVQNLARDLAHFSPAVRKSGAHKADRAKWPRHTAPLGKTAPGRGAQRPPLDSTQTALPFFKARLHRGPARAQRSLTNLVYVAPRPIPPTAVHARRATPAHKYEPEHCPAGLGHLRTGARGLNCQRPFCGPPRRHRWRSHQSSAPTPRSPLS